MRLFAAIVPPREVLDQLSDELERLGPLAKDDPAVRWNQRALWHLTLAFYGEDELRTRSAKLAEQVGGTRRFRLSLDGSGTFRGVLWVGVSGDLDTLGALAASVGDPERTERRPYHAHVTLARWKRPSPPRSARWLARQLAGFRGRPWRVDEVALMSSELSHRGPAYTVRQRYPLH